jgi:hypothetical protein
VGSALATRVAAPATVGSVALDPRFRAELSKAGNKTREWTARRDELIRLAHLDGASLREIAAAVGLSTDDARLSRTAFARGSGAARQGRRS